MSDSNIQDKAYAAGQKTAAVLEGGTRDTTGLTGGAPGSDTGDKSLFDKEGAIGKHFQADGAIGSVGESIGGPLSKDGAIGKQFTTDGTVGGTVQKNLGDQK